MKIIYMGTPDFAVAPLEALIKAGHSIELVVTQPDREKGRGKEIAMSPVKECAIKHGIEVFQPLKIRETEAVNKLREYDADIFVVAAFGQIVSEDILNMPRYGCVNIHASLLPKYRGAAPIQWAVLNGEKYTGVTIQQMAKGIDTGDILYQKQIPITDEDTGESMFDKLMYLGADMIAEFMPLLENGKITPVPQKEEEATHVGKISKELGLINWNDDAAKIERYVRGLNSWPSAYTTLNGKTLKIWKSKVTQASEKISAEPGTIVAVNKDSFDVATGDGCLTVFEIQLEGKKRMSVHDFLLGFKIEKGVVLS